MSLPTPEQLMSLPPAYLAQNDSRKLMDTSITFIVISTIFFGLFITSRIVHNGKDSWDVWILPPFAFVCVLGLAVIGILIVQIGGGGRHIAYHMLHDPIAIKRYLQLQTATEFLYVVAVTVPKLTILFLYLRVFSNLTSKIVRRLTWAMIVIVLLQWLTVGVIVWATICRPLRFKWDKSINGHCTDLLASYRYFSVPNILTDIVILLLPISTIWNLQVSKLQKVGIFLTFLTGSLGIVAAVIRFVGFFTVDLNADPTYYVVTTMLLSIAEPGAYFICSTLPYIRPLANRFYQRSGLATAVGRSRLGATMLSSKRSSKRTFNGPEHAKSGYSATASALGSSVIDDDRVGFIELVETVEVDSNRV